MRIYKKWASAIWSCIIVFFGYKYSNKPIPEGPYCYVPDEEANNKKADTDYSYYIKTCKYFSYLGKRYCACRFCGIITDDMTFCDQCKICGENKGYLDGPEDSDIKEH